MPSKKYWKKITLGFLDSLKKASGTRIKLFGYSFVILPDVFSPSCSSDTEWFAKKLIPYVKNLSFLEIGTGTGIIAALAALNGSSPVVATDINPNAIENAKLNRQLLKLDFSIREGNVFDPINENEFFDAIFWNHPFNYSEERSLQEDPLGSSVFDYRYEALEEFLHKGKKHLKKNGKIFLGSSNIARIQLIKQIAKKEGYSFTLLKKSEVPAYKTRKVKMDVRLYALEVKNRLKIS